MYSFNENTNSPIKSTTENLLSYEGPFFIDLLTIFGNYIKLYLKNNLIAQKKLFKIYVELAQNVAFYSEESYLLKNENKKIGIGEMNLKETDTDFRFTTRNLVKSKDAKILSQRCEIINDSDFNKLKELKRNLRMSSPGEKYGARIGLIQAKLISKNNIEYSLIEKNKDYSIFKITAKINNNGEY
ncbi:MAG: SiaB family protein kinase [Bacteroidales bacterium]